MEHLPACPHGLSTSYRKVVKSQLLCPNSLLGTSQAVETGGRQPNLHLLALKEMTSSRWLAEVFVERRICSVAWKILQHSLESLLSPFSPCLCCLLIKKLPLKLPLKPASPSQQRSSNPALGDVKEGGRCPMQTGRRKIAAHVQYLTRSRIYYTSGGIYYSI